MTIRENSMKMKTSQGGSLLQEELEQCSLLMPKAAFLLLPSLGRFCSKIKIGSIVPLFLIFSVSIVGWLELSFADKWNNRYKSIKMFLCTRTIGSENKGQGRRRDVIWFGLLTKRPLKYQRRKHKVHITQQQSMPTSSYFRVYIAWKFMNTLQKLNQSSVFYRTPQMDQVTV